MAVTLPGRAIAQISCRTGVGSSFFSSLKSIPGLTGEPPAAAPRARPRRPGLKPEESAGPEQPGHRPQARDTSLPPPGLLQADFRRVAGRNRLSSRLSRLYSAKFSAVQALRIPNVSG